MRLETDRKSWLTWSGGGEVSGERAQQAQQDLGGLQAPARPMRGQCESDAGREGQWWARLRSDSRYIASSDTMDAN